MKNQNDFKVEELEQRLELCNWDERIYCNNADAE